MNYLSSISSWFRLAELPRKIFVLCLLVTGIHTAYAQSCTSNKLTNGSLENGTFAAATVTDGNGTAITTVSTTYGGSSALQIPFSSDPPVGHPITGFKVNTGYWVDGSTNGGSGSVDGNRLLVIHAGTGASRCLWPGGLGFSHTVNTCYRVSFWAAHFNPSSMGGTSSINFEVENSYGTGVAGGSLSNFSISPAAQNLSNPNFQTHSFALPSSGSTAKTIAGASYTGTGVVNWATLNWQLISFDFTPGVATPPLNVYISTNGSSNGVALDGFCITECGVSTPCTAVTGAIISKSPSGTVVAGTTVTLTANKTDAGTPTAYTWAANPSTGFTSTNQTATLTNPSAGTINFSVTIQNNNGTGTCSASATTSLSVSSAPPCSITGTLTQSTCQDNGTKLSTKQADDYFNITFSATGSNTGVSGVFEVVMGANADGTGGNVQNSGGTAYGQSVVINGLGRFKADGTTTYGNLIVRDKDTPTCKFTLPTTAIVNNCSNDCPPQLCPTISISKN